MIIRDVGINWCSGECFQERRREDEARKAQEILQRRRNREDEAEVDGRPAEMSVGCYFHSV